MLERKYIVPYRPSSLSKKIVNIRNGFRVKIKSKCDCRSPVKSSEISKVVHNTFLQKWLLRLGRLCSLAG